MGSQKHSTFLKLMPPTWPDLLEMCSTGLTVPSQGAARAGHRSPEVGEGEAGVEGSCRSALGLWAPACRAVPCWPPAGRGAGEARRSGGPPSTGSRGAEKASWDSDYITSVTDAGDTSKLELG